MSSFCILLTGHDRSFCDSFLKVGRDKNDVRVRALSAAMVCFAPQRVLHFTLGKVKLASVTVVTGA